MASVRRPAWLLAKRLLGGWLLTAAYLAVGRLALLLAVPPGYATPIFPPAGLAIVAMLIFGPSTLPWTWLGSFLLNLWTAYAINIDRGLEMDLLSASAVATAAVIATASALQAAIGGVVLRRATGYPALFGNDRELWRSLLLTPVCCLTSATVSLVGLLLIGAVEPPHVVLHWFSWWAGDTFGALAMLPFYLLLGVARRLGRPD
jgi:integral membrane sensor domain MASE1